ncbi:hypothetical protein AQUCO_00500369v1 [Aquilegia coerulea]|uniref:Uncharacterized protein n=1 Tax=Aquilegia coerulea TaxID=218851 RepID=A0A2G5ERV5_AQUCA|nr:hypothetical protein AQUCO_00500369v1 [Aquilegia coerulea]
MIKCSSKNNMIQFTKIMHTDIRRAFQNLHLLTTVYFRIVFVSKCSCHFSFVPVFIYNYYVVFGYHLENSLKLD